MSSRRARPAGSTRRSTTGVASRDASSAAGEVPVVGMREPCPCGSGRRYKACHGRDVAQRGIALVRRPFEGLPGECDIVAMREIVPAATMTYPLAAPNVGRDVVIATVLPMAWPGLVRVDGQILLGLQTQGGSGDASRDAGEALARALDSEPGTPIPAFGLPGPGPRLQDLLAHDASPVVAVHEGFDFWLDGAAELTGEVATSLERANASVVPTRRLSGVEAAYWVRLGSKEHLRWVLPTDEDRTLDAFARLHAAGSDDVGTGTRFIGSFRAHGLLVPVWDLAPGTEADDVEEPALAWRARFDEAYGDATPLTDAQRRARAGLANRQLTLR